VDRIIDQLVDGNMRRMVGRKIKKLRSGEFHQATEAWDGWMMGFEPTTLRTTI
jgi:hypothetical protein